MSYEACSFYICSDLIIFFTLCTEVSASDEEQKKITNSIGMEFVYIEPGTFMMGSPEDEMGRSSDETQHEVTLTQGYYMQTTEVTQGQWAVVMEDNPSGFSDCGDDSPVEMVSWNDVQDFISALNDLEDTDHYVLPTEAQWEYAARAGTTTPFYFGRCLSTDQANYDGNSPLPGCPKGEYRKKTTLVKKFPANAWGLYDMHGNVYEWLADWYGTYPTTAVTDPTGPESGNDRVIRGGSWGNGARRLRSAFRIKNYPTGFESGIGFRLSCFQIIEQSRSDKSARIRTIMGQRGTVHFRE